MPGLAIVLMLEEAALCLYWDEDNMASGNKEELVSAWALGNEVPSIPGVEMGGGQEQRLTAHGHLQ